MPVSNYKVQIRLAESAMSIFRKAYRIPCSLEEKIKTSLNILQGHNLFQPVSYSEWATSIVIVPKRYGKIRICADYKVTVNKSLDKMFYPLPLMEDILHKLHGADTYVVLDLHQASQQMPIDERSQKVLTINTPWGLYQMKRLPFGLSSSPFIFQQYMDGILEYDFAQAYIDDAIIGGHGINACFTTLTRY